MIFPNDANGDALRRMCPHATVQVALRAYFNPLQTAGEGITMAGVVSPRNERTADGLSFALSKSHQSLSPLE